MHKLGNNSLSAIVLMAGKVEKFFDIWRCQLLLQNLINLLAMMKPTAAVVTSVGCSSQQAFILTFGIDFPFWRAALISRDAYELTVHLKKRKQDSGGIAGPSRRGKVSLQQTSLGG